MNILKEKFHQKAITLRSEIKLFLKENGDKKVDEVSLRQMFGGMRGVKSMVWQTSQLDPYEGIRFRGYSIPELREKLPKSNGCTEPLPEGLFWLMLTGEIPNQEEVEWLCDEWETRNDIPFHTYAMLDSLPTTTHPMTQFILAINSLQTESVFAKRYAEGLHKNAFWDPTFEDTMNLIAKLPLVAAYIYRRSFKDNKHIPADLDLDWAGNFAHMLGNEDETFQSMFRLYMTIHADHEGGNASAHTSHLINSTLADPYLAFSGGMCSLAGPLHGLANQEVIQFISNMIKDIGSSKPTNQQVESFVQKTLNDGKVIPGYGHAVLRRPDPRFVALKDFSEKHIKDSDFINIVWQLFDIVPKALESLGKVRNPWPNIDAHSGAVLIHYGLKEYSYYTVLFGVSRALGVLASLCWSRALGFPLERPKSMTFESIKASLES